MVEYMYVSRLECPIDHSGPHFDEHVIISPRTRWRYPGKCSVGAYSIVDDFCYISAALTIGRFSHISANCTILGGAQQVTIGDFVDIAPGCSIVSAGQDYLCGGLSSPCIPDEYRGESISKPIIIEDHVLLGANTVVLPGTHIPRGVATGAFTLLGPKDNLQPWTLYFGHPAMKYKARLTAAILEAANRLRSAHPEVFG